MIRQLAVRCPAKINTRLLVLGRRPDGYHELDLDFISLALSDRLELEPADHFALDVVGAPPESVPVADNLVLRAAALLQEEVGQVRLPGARMRLTKHIPAAAGLGGGSSDAAGALEGLGRLAGLSLPPERLEALALALGSDVPYFLKGGGQRGTGRGELLSSRPDGPDRGVILLHPARGLSTRLVFEELARQRGPASGPLTSRKTGTTFPGGPHGPLSTEPLNDLLPAALALAPELGAILEAARRICPEGNVGLTGSGPTLFVLLEFGTDPADVRDRLVRSLSSEVGLTVTRTMGAAEYQATRFEP